MTDEIRGLAGTVDIREEYIVIVIGDLMLFGCQEVMSVLQKAFPSLPWEQPGIVFNILLAAGEDEKAPEGWKTMTIHDMFVPDEFTVDPPTQVDQLYQMSKDRRKRHTTAFCWYEIGKEPLEGSYYQDMDFFLPLVVKLFGRIPNEPQLYVHFRIEE